MSAVPGGSQEAPETGSKPGQGLVITLNRVKNMIKDDIEVKSISSEAIFAVAKATELLLEDMTQRGVEYMLKENRNTLDYKDVAGAVADHTGYDFLDDIIPQKVPAGVALARMKQQTQQQPEDPKQENKPET